jgi:hypothetical protein
VTRTYASPEAFKSGLGCAREFEMPAKSRELRARCPLRMSAIVKRTSQVLSAAML